jgi:DNA mismatch repair ATPase MutS
MFTFKECITTVPVFKFVYDHLHFCSPLGRKELLQSKFITKAEHLEDCFNEIETVMRWQETYPEPVQKVKKLLTHIQDIFGTLSRLKNNDALDDIELFEIKKSALFMHDLNQIVNATSFSLLSMYDVNETIKILDPEKSLLPHFYIYSCYSKELATLRNRTERVTSPEEKEDLLWQISKLENKIRQNLVKKLQPFASQLAHNLKLMAKLDLLLAKTALAIEWNCCKPEISGEKISYEGLFHPVVVHRLQKENMIFQPVNIELKQEPCLITGANMTGKSIFLRAIAFSQWMFQFGFYVPAQKAAIIPVEKIHFVSGDSDTDRKSVV